MGGADYWRGYADALTHWVGVVQKRASTEFLEAREDSAHALRGLSVDLNLAAGDATANVEAVEHEEHPNAI